MYFLVNNSGRKNANVFLSFFLWKGQGKLKIAQIGQDCFK